MKPLRPLVLLITLLIIYLFFSFIKDDLIVWQADRKLTWADFKATPDKNSSNAALSSTNIGLGWGYNTSQGFTYTITCTFDKNKSWVRIQNDHILDHEQRHFDLTEIYARKLRQALSEYHYKPKTVNKDVEDIYEKLTGELITMQEKYDQETQHSKNVDKQKEWVELIDKRLQELKKYTGDKVKDAGFLSKKPQCDLSKTPGSTK